MAKVTNPPAGIARLPKGAPSLTAAKRQVLGRKVKTLRRQGILPANVYGRHVKSTAVQVKTDEFKKIFGQAGETGLVGLRVNGDVHPVLIHNIHIDPVTDEPLHADLLEVNLAEKVAATVPIEIIGESPAEKTAEGVIVQQMHEVEVEALPADLPEKIIVDISGLVAVDDAIKVSQLSVDKSKVEVKDDPERIVVNVAPPAKEEEITPPVEEVPAEEGAAPAEGEAAEGEAPEAPAEGKAPAKGETETDKDKEGEVGRQE